MVELKVFQNEYQKTVAGSSGIPNVFADMVPSFISAMISLDVFIIEL